MEAPSSTYLGVFPLQALQQAAACVPSGAFFALPLRPQHGMTESLFHFPPGLGCSYSLLVGVSVSELKQSSFLAGEPTDKLHTPSQEAACLAALVISRLLS